MGETTQEPDTLTIVNTRLLREILTDHLDEWTRRLPGGQTYCVKCGDVRHRDGCTVEYAIRVMEATR